MDIEVDVVMGIEIDLGVVIDLVMDVNRVAEPLIQIQPPRAEFLSVQGVS